MKFGYMVRGILGVKMSLYTAGLLSQMDILIAMRTRVPDQWRSRIFLSHVADTKLMS